ncbi:MAG: GNAT family N-acetyltransferase [Acidimicrobiia bacterium]
MSNSTIREIFPLTSDADLDMMLPVYNTVWDELNPQRSHITGADYRSSINRSSIDTRHFVTIDDVGLANGLAVASHFVDGSNEHLQWLVLLVRPDARRRGIARALLARAHEFAVDSGRSKMTAETFASMPDGALFAERIGADIGMREDINFVDIDALDLPMLERWRGEGPSRAPGYEVLVWDDAYPPESYDALARLVRIAEEDMPMEDLEFDPLETTADTIREWVANAEGVLEFITAVPRHIESGELVGFSELIYRFSDPHTMQTALTVVHRDHRGYALGKWIKAAAILRGVERWPDAVRIKTENAHSNDAMLGINHEIGFEKRNTVLDYQASTDVIAAYLTRR